MCVRRNDEGHCFMAGKHAFEQIVCRSAQFVVHNPKFVVTNQSAIIGLLWHCIRITRDFSSANHSKSMISFTVIRLNGRSQDLTIQTTTDKLRFIYRRRRFCTEFSTALSLSLSLCLCVFEKRSSFAEEINEK